MEQNNSSLRAILLECTTHQLDVMLQAELNKDPIDEAAVRMIMGVLEEREADHPVDVSDDVAAAWKKYQAGQDGERRRSPTKHIIRWDWAVKAASILLAIGVAVSVFSQEVSAEAFFGKIARWSDSIFEFFSPGYQNDNKVEYIFKTDHSGLQQVYDLVSEMGVTVPVVPMYMPDELELTELKQEVISKGVGIVAVFSGRMGDTVLRIDIYSDNVSSEYQKDIPDVRFFEKSGITHYLMQNNETYSAVWTNKNVECLIITDCQEEVLLGILKSVYIAEGE